MTRDQLLKVSGVEGGNMPGPVFRRVECLVPGIGVEVWATLLSMAGQRFTLEEIHPTLAGAGNPKLFTTEGEAVDWLVGAICAAPIAVEAQATLDRLAAEEAAKSETRRVEELIKARALVEAHDRRVAQTESA